MLVTVLERFLLGLLGAFSAGILVFRLRTFDPADPAFSCITVGALAAGVLALLRSGRPLQAVGLAAAFALFRLGLVEAVGWVPACAGLVLGAGILVVGLIFDMLARRGIRFGKFLVVGPLIGGLYLAAAPLLEFHTMTSVGAVRTLLQYTFLGVVMGDGVGLGVEVADLLAASQAKARDLS